MVSNKNLFRKNKPVRTCTKKYINYRSYKDALQSDFKGRCGYTDCPDYFFGGKRTFHIDHFKPQKTHKHLVNEYSNLIYTCSYVNLKKSDNLTELLDPCDIDLNVHFYRDEYGNIVPFSSSTDAISMAKALGLNMKRYGIIWMLESLENLKTSLSQICEGNDNFESASPEALKILARLNKAHQEYTEYLRVMI